MKKKLKLLFATDLHGSEVCFRKLFNLAPRAKADVIVIGGDFCGKGFIPLVREGTTYTGELFGSKVVAETETERQDLEKRIRFRGFYPMLCDPDELAMLSSDAEERDKRLTLEMVRTVERWVEIAEEKLADSEVECVCIPGNDDEYEIDAALNQSSRMVNCDGRTVRSGDVDILGFGASNPTPWETPRELSEEEISRGLAEALSSASGDRLLVADIHVPPFASTLDDAPALDDELRPLGTEGSPVMAPVGSHAVRTFLEETDLPLSLHGHVHESRGTTTIGGTVALNPGSDYSAGTLQAAVITLDMKRNRVMGTQFISA